MNEPDPTATQSRSDKLEQVLAKSLEFSPQGHSVRSLLLGILETPPCAAAFIVHTIAGGPDYQRMITDVRDFIAKSHPGGPRCDSTDAVAILKHTAAADDPDASGDNSIPLLTAISRHEGAAGRILRSNGVNADLIARIHNPGPIPQETPLHKLPHGVIYPLRLAEAQLDNCSPELLFTIPWPIRKNLRQTIADSLRLCWQRLDGRVSNYPDIQERMRVARERLDAAFPEHG